MNQLGKLGLKLGKKVIVLGLVALGAYVIKDTLNQESKEGFQILKQMYNVAKNK